VSAEIGCFPKRQKLIDSRARNGKVAADGTIVSDLKFYKAGAKVMMGCGAAELNGGVQQLVVFWGTALTVRRDYNNVCPTYVTELSLH
jgi:hypothetical protein